MPARFHWTSSRLDYLAGINPRQMLDLNEILRRLNAMPGPLVPSTRAVLYKLSQLHRSPARAPAFEPPVQKLSSSCRTCGLAAPLAFDPECSTCRANRVMATLASIKASAGLSASASHQVIMAVIQRHKAKQAQERARAPVHQFTGPCLAPVRPLPPAPTLLNRLC